jgi:hypothetical protein
MTTVTCTARVYPHGAEAAGDVTLLGLDDALSEPDASSPVPHGCHAFRLFIPVACRASSRPRWGVSSNARASSRSGTATPSRMLPRAHQACGPATPGTRDDADESEGWSERSVATDQSRAATSPTDRLLPNRPPLHRDRLVTWRAPTRRCKPIAFRPRADVPVEKTSRATTPAPDAATRRAAIGHHAAYHRRRSSAPAHGIPCRGDQIALDFVASRSARTSRITRVRRA